MSRMQIRIVMALLITLHVAAALLLTPFGLSANDHTLSQRAWLMAIGVLISQPALAALWAALAPQAFARRWAQALVMLALVDLASDFASLQNASHVSDAGDIAYSLLWLVAFLLSQLPLLPLRRRYRWRIESPVTLQQRTAVDDKQFSLSTLLATTAGMAAFLAVLRWLHPASGESEWAFHLVRYVTMGAMTALPGMLVLIVGWLMLTPEFRSSWRWSIAVLGSCAMVAAASAVAAFGSPGEVGELVFILLGTLLSSAASLLVVRFCGYRLVRKVHDQQIHDAPISENLPPAVPRRRFAFMIVVMTVLVLGLMSFVPARLAVWRDMAERRGWSACGLLAATVDGQVTNLKVFDGLSTRIDQAAMARINRCDHLQKLELCGPTVTDETLELLEALPRLTSLSLLGAHISDDGLRHLAKFRNLNNLDLRMTDVTDDGLVILERFRNLYTIDLGHTRVTQEGLAWLDDARPGIRASAITNDMTLGQVARFFRPRRTPLSRGGASPPINVCVRATGPGVTDIGVPALRGMTHIAELDLSDAKVTDTSVNNLITLAGLKQLVLTGTQVTDVGVERLRQALPECEIVR